MRLADRLDNFLLTPWWWRTVRQIAEGRLAKVLEGEGDASIAAHLATERLRRLDFALLYGCKAPDLIMRIVNDAARRGVTRRDLQLLLFNRDLSLHNGRVEVRRSNAFRLIAATSTVAIFAPWTLLCSVAIATGPLWLKGVVAGAMLTVYAGLWRGWSLYMRGSRAAFEFSGASLEELSERTPNERNVREIRECAPFQ